MKKLMKVLLLGLMTLLVMSVYSQKSPAVGNSPSNDVIKYITSIEKTNYQIVEVNEISDYTLKMAEMPKDVGWQNIETTIYNKEKSTRNITLLKNSLIIIQHKEYNKRC